MSYREEFADFDPATMPAIPADFVDVSWGNDMCPSFEARGVALFIDFADPAQREFQDSPRFTARRGFDGADIIATDSWEELLAALPAPAAA